MFAETATTEISEKGAPKNFPENRTVAREGGSIAGNARRQIESKTGKRALSRDNFKSLQARKRNTLPRR